MNPDRSRMPEPPPAMVARNEWTRIAVPDIGAWSPDRRVTVVIPHYEAPTELNLTLAALTRQTYPRDLMEVVIVDDGSTNPPEIPPFAAKLDTRVEVQERHGYGLARARNLGARLAAGEILVFIDCDMIPEAQHIEAHARWHHAVSDAMVFGFRWHAEFKHVGPDDIAAAIDAGDVSSILPGQTPKRPEWIEAHLDRTEMLTAAVDDQFLVTSGGNLSIRRDQYLDIGGTDESFDQWGGEDNEFGFRVVQAGLVVVPDRLAVCWHQGEGHEPSIEELRSHRLQQPKMRNMIAELGYRAPRSGCTYTVPYAVVTVDAGTMPAETTASTVESILGSTFHDLVVVVRAPETSSETEWLRRRFASDDRVRIVDEAWDIADGYRFSPLRIGVPCGTLFHQGTLDKVVDGVRAQDVGMLHATLPETSPESGKLTAVSTRALNRARRSAATPDQIGVLIDELFGERWVSSRALGLGMIHGSYEVTHPTDPSIGPDAAGSSTPTAAELALVQAQLAELQTRRALRLADAAGTLKASRNKDQTVFAVKSLVQALRGNVEPSDEA